MTDESTYDIISCPEGCGFYHIMLVEGFKTKEQAVKAIKKLIKSDNKMRGIVKMNKFVECHKCNTTLRELCYQKDGTHIYINKLYCHRCETIVNKNEK